LLPGELDQDCAIREGKGTLLVSIDRQLIPHDGPKLA
jgi:hypothetical protein